MKTKNLFVALIVLMMSSMISLSSCKKDTVETPAPIPPYVPVFSSTDLPIGNLLDFYITCPTDDYELISVKVTYPGVPETIPIQEMALLFSKATRLHFQVFFQN